VIYDSLSNLHYYETLNTRIKTGIEYLKRSDLAALSDGIYEIEGREVYAFVNTFTTRDRDGALFEVHRNYIDLQVLSYGSETIYYAQAADLIPETGYDPEKDIEFLSGESLLTLPFRTGEFYLFFPHDAHMPCCHLGSSAHEVKKVVIKIRQ
jgi:YhcH/YjgK/YiaL family protein